MEQESGLYFFRHGEIPKRSGQDVPPGAHNYGPEFDQDYVEGDPFYIPPDAFGPEEKIAPGRHRVLGELERRAKQAYNQALADGKSDEEARLAEARTANEWGGKILVVRPGALEDIENEARAFHQRIQYFFASDVPRAYQSAAVFRNARPDEEKKIDIGVEAGFGEVLQPWSKIQDQELKPGTQRYEVVERLLRALDRVVPLAENGVVAVFAHNGVKKTLWNLFQNEQKHGKFQYATPDKFNLELCKERMEYWRQELARAREERVS